MSFTRTTVTRSLLATGAASLGVLAGFPAAAGAAPAATAGTGSARAGCTASDYLVARSAPLSRAGGSTSGMVYLYYSSSTRCVYGSIVTGAPGCVPGDNFCGNARVVRSDGATASCNIPAGSSSCRTVAINDAGYTAYAEASYDNGPWTYSGKTGSF